MFFIPDIGSMYLNNQRLQKEREGDARLRALPREQQEFELRLREVKAQETRARKDTIIKVRSSIF